MVRFGWTYNRKSHSAKQLRSVAGKTTACDHELPRCGTGLRFASCCRLAGMLLTKIEITQKDFRIRVGPSLIVSVPAQF